MDFLDEILDIFLLDELYDLATGGKEKRDERRERKNHMIMLRSQIRSAGYVTRARGMRLDVFNNDLHRIGSIHANQHPYEVRAYHPEMEQVKQYF